MTTGLRTDMTENEAQTHREAAAEALANGDGHAANEAYTAELEALDGTRESEQDVAEQDEYDKPEYGEGVFDFLVDEFGEETTAQLRAHWPDEESVREGIALGQALVEDHPELTEIAEEFGLADHPALLRMAEAIARKSGYTFDANGAQRSTDKQETTPMEANLSQENYAKTMRDFNSRIELAQSEGNSKLANFIYIEQMDWLASVKGDSPIVGGRTNTTIRNV